MTVLLNAKVVRATFLEQTPNLVENSEVMEEDEEPMDFEDIVLDDSSSSSDESVTQTLGKYYCSKRYII